jgi:hypothetical protein
MRRVALAGCAIFAAVAGCKKQSPQDERDRFLLELKNHYEFTLSRDEAKLREGGAGISYEYRDIKYPAANETDMPVAKRRDVVGTAPNDPKAEQDVEGAYRAEVSYVLVTQQREIARRLVPQDPVGANAKVDAIGTVQVVGPVYRPVAYSKGRCQFVYVGGRIVPARAPYEEGMTEEERSRLMKKPAEQTELK